MMSSDGARPALATPRGIWAEASPEAAEVTDKGMIVDAMLNYGDNCCNGFASNNGIATLEARRTAVRSRGELGNGGAVMMMTPTCSPRLRRGGGSVYR
jgi:hypothetical protein